MAMEKDKTSKFKKGGTVKLVSDLNFMARRLAESMKFMSPSLKHVNEKSFCPRCKMIFCLGFDGVTVFCGDCFYKKCCAKELVSTRACNHCLGLRRRFNIWGKKLRL